MNALRPTLTVSMLLLCAMGPMTGLVIALSAARASAMPPPPPGKGGGGGNEAPSTGVVVPFNPDTLEPFAVRSDGMGRATEDDDPGSDPDLYVDEVDCVNVGTGAKDFRIRTVAFGCFTGRTLTLDFGADAPADLDDDGTAESVEEPICRFIADDAYGPKAERNGAPIEIQVFTVNPDTTMNTTFTLEYANPAAVVDLGGGSRDIFLLPGEAAADLFQRTPEGPIYLGTFDMPFYVEADAN